MTRQKKSRKIGQIGTRKQDVSPSETTTPRRKKAPKGQKSGSRNSLIDEKALGNTPQGEKSKKDPKLGSKKKIELVKSESVPKPEKKEIQHSAEKPKVQLQKVQKEQMTPQQELAALESDQRLIELAERVENGDLLTGKDAKYFNQKMARHEALMDELGLDEDRSDEDPLDQLGSDQWDDLLDDEQ